MARRGHTGHSEVERLIEEARAAGATELDLSARSLTELPAAIGQLRQLQELNLTRAKPQQQPAERVARGDRRVDPAPKHKPLPQPAEHAARGD
jgi:hypothetical protein